MEAVETVDSVLKMTERVLNPASHGNTTPLYEEEVRRAKSLIDRLEHLLGQSHERQSTRKPQAQHILLYQTDDGTTRVEVRMAGETVWLNQNQIAALFLTTKQNRTKYYSLNVITHVLTTFPLVP